MSDPISEARRRLEISRARTRALQVAQMDPQNNPNEVEALKHLERSQRAETKLRIKALAYEEEKQRQGK